MDHQSKWERESRVPRRKYLSFLSAPCPLEKPQHKQGKGGTLLLGSHHSLGWFIHSLLRPVFPLGVHVLSSLLISHARRFPGLFQVGSGRRVQLRPEEPSLVLSAVRVGSKLPSVLTGELSLWNSLFFGLPGNFLTLSLWYSLHSHSCLLSGIISAL